MKIGLISDTHIPAFSKEPPSQVADVFAGVDLILHAGDIYSFSCLDWLERIAPVYAVEWVGHASADDDPRVEHKRVLELEGYTIGMVHDLALPGMMFPGPLPIGYGPTDDPLPAALAKFFGSPVDVVVFGHTHTELVEERHGILLVNPGSPTLPRHSVCLGTVGILELTAQGATARIIDLAGLV